MSFPLQRLRSTRGHVNGFNTRELQVEEEKVEGEGEGNKEEQKIAGEKKIFYHYMSDKI